MDSLGVSFNRKSMFLVKSLILRDLESLEIEVYLRSGGFLHDLIARFSFESAALHALLSEMDGNS